MLNHYITKNKAMSGETAKHKREKAKDESEKAKDESEKAKDESGN